MTISEAIESIDALKYNVYTQSDKIKWLSRLDLRVKKEIIDTHNVETTEFTGYTDETPLDTELLVPAPYDEVYLRYMEMQIDYTNGEYGKYNNSAAMFNNAFNAYWRYYNRTHMPVGHMRKYF